MSFLLSLLTSQPYFTPPSLAGWVVWFALLGVTLWLAMAWRGLAPEGRRSVWIGLFALAAATPLAGLFAGIRLPAGAALPLPGLPAEPGVTLMPFSSLPWALASGLLGPLPGALIGLLGGLLRGLWDTHSLFTALNLALTGLLFSAAVNQRYRTPFFRLLRQPLLAALALVPLLAGLQFVGSLLILSGTPTARLDFALSTLGAGFLATLGELLVAGLIAQAVKLAFPSAWGRGGPLTPSPAERSMETRFLSGTSAFVLVVLLASLIGDWIVAGAAARRMLEERLASTAALASQNVPFLIEYGQTLAAQTAADPDLAVATDAQLAELLADHMRASPFFDQLLMLSADGRLLSAYPADAAQGFSLYPEENAGLVLAMSGIPVQVYTIPPAEVGRPARISFLALVPGQSPRILLGRSGLDSNPLAQPLLNALSDLGSLQGTAMLLDQDGRILVHPSPERVMQPYPGELPAAPGLSEQAAPDGTRQLVYFQPVVGQPWSVVLTVPARQVQQVALDIAAPLSILIVLLALIALVTLRIGLRVVTRSLHSLAVEADRIAQGQLDHPLHVQGVDEIGQLRRAFEQMRLGLRERLDELNRLLNVSLGVAASLDMQDAVQPVLEAVLAAGASAARVVLSPAGLPDAPVKTPTRFALGPSAANYADLDETILALAEKQEILVLTNTSRTRLLDPAPAGARPGALLAVGLRHENRYYGVMWAAYDRTRTFSDADVRFISTLAGQAALAAANARLFRSVEIGRQQLEAILASTPDPVLVTDPQDRLLLANPAAGQVFGQDLLRGIGRPIEQLIEQPALLSLLQASATVHRSAEISLPSGQIFMATASSVTSEGRPFGRVCLLRDITTLKELDLLKSEFVATVSHDLRSPLTLMRGYATMLETVGELNSQQQGYVAKIVAGVENMARLVNNLLDLGRIEIGVGLQVEPVGVQEIAEQVTGELQPQAVQKKIALRVIPQDGLPERIEADQALLHQALYNLVENAIKYGRDQGQVTVHIRAGSDHVTFAVEDNGIGIAASDLPRLFEKFYRGKQREARAQQGTGLGLAIVRSIAERHGGRVWVESQVGRGSVFFLQIPVAQPEAVQKPAE